MSVSKKGVLSIPFNNLQRRRHFVFPFRGMRVNAFPESGPSPFARCIKILLFREIQRLRIYSMRPIAALRFDSAGINPNRKDQALQGGWL